MEVWIMRDTLVAGGSVALEEWVPSWMRMAGSGSRGGSGGVLVCCARGARGHTLARAAARAQAL